jgi:hypothetical protein
MSELDVVTATDCTALSILDNYRADFLQALNKNVPKVLEGLRDVFAVCEARSLFSQGSDKALLVEQVEAWGQRFNLMDPWLHEAATLTLHQWHTDPASAGALRWADPPNKPSQVLPPAERLKFETQGWFVEREGWTEFKKRATHTLNQHLKTYKADTDAKLEGIGFRPTPKLREPDHFGWLALYQVHSWSPRKIATTLIENGGRDINENGVLRAIHRKAKLIGLTLRPNNKGKGKKPPIVAHDPPPKFAAGYMT